MRDGFCRMTFKVKKRIGVLKFKVHKCVSDGRDHVSPICHPRSDLRTSFAPSEVGSHGDLLSSGLLTMIERDESVEEANHHVVLLCTQTLAIGAMRLRY